MNFLKLIEALENAGNDTYPLVKNASAVPPVKVRMTPEQRARLEELRAKRNDVSGRAAKKQPGSSVSGNSAEVVTSGSITDFIETENIEFHEDGHSDDRHPDQTEPVASVSVSGKRRVGLSDVRRGFVYSEIIGKPLALRKK